MMNLQCLNENGQYKIDYCIIYDVDIYDEGIANSFHIIFGADNRKCLISKRKNGVLQPNPYFKELDKKFSSFNLCYLMYSNIIASTSNVIWVGGNMIAGNEGAIKELDIGGLIVTLHRLMTDTKFIRQVKEEFIFGGFNKMIQGDDLNLKEVTLWE